MPTSTWIWATVGLTADSNQHVESFRGLGRLDLDPLCVGGGVHGQNRVAQLTSIEGPADLESEDFEGGIAVHRPVALDGERGNGSLIDVGGQGQGGGRDPCGNHGLQDQARTGAAGGEDSHHAGSQ